jgi:hypothetical protein
MGASTSSSHWSLSSSEVEDISWSPLGKDKIQGSQSMIFYGEYNGTNYIKKVPTITPDAAWDLEVRNACLHSDYRTGPNVVFARLHHPRVLVMEKYDITGIEALEHNHLKDSMLEHTRNLIERLADFYASRKDTPVCITDFKLGNIVYKISGDEIIDARQIDFDLCIHIDLSREEFIILSKMVLMVHRNFIDHYRQNYCHFLFYGEVVNGHENLKNAVRKTWRALHENKKWKVQDIIYDRYRETKGIIRNFGIITGLPWDTDEFDLLWNEIRRRFNSFRNPESKLRL